MVFYTSSTLDKTVAECSLDTQHTTSITVLGEQFLTKEKMLDCPIVIPPMELRDMDYKRSSSRLKQKM